MSLNLLFLVGAAVSGTVLAVLAVVYCRMGKTSLEKPAIESALSSDVLESLKAAHEARKHEKAMTMPEAADYSEGSQVTRELQSDADTASAFSHKSESKKTFLEIMTQLTREEKKD